jgi:protein-tyrosine phosphatase
MTTTKVLFVCMGNICRSPTAEGVFTKLIQERRVDKQFRVDSAGTHSYHVGDAPDLRAQRAARERGVELSHLRARKVRATDFEEFDYLLVMDDDNHAHVMAICPPEHKDKVSYFLSYAPQLNIREVPDPYYGGRNGFEKVLDMVELAAEGFLAHVQKSGRL